MSSDLFVELEHDDKERIITMQCLTQSPCKHRNSANELSVIHSKVLIINCA